MYLCKGYVVLLWFILSLTWQRQGHCAGSHSLRLQTQLHSWHMATSGNRDADRNSRISSLYSFPILTLHCGLLRTGYRLWDEQRSFINISQCSWIWCTCNLYLRERSRNQELCLQQTQCTILWALRLADFGAQAYEHTHSFMLWFLDLAHSVPREI